MSATLLGPADCVIEGSTGLTGVLEVPGAAAVPVFVIRYRQELKAWVNRCPHRGTALDWEPGEFFDDAGQHLVCATHGALFEPISGLCVEGPCRGAHLQALAVAETDGRVVVGWRDARDRG